jgi:hypothetical protein
MVRRGDAWIMTDLISDRAWTADSDRRQTGRHRAPEEPHAHGVENTVADADELLVVRLPDSLPPYPDQGVTGALLAAKNRTALATHLAGGAGAAAFHAAIDAARTSASRRRIERLDDDKIAETGYGRPTSQAGT